jgi:predicted nuclease of predicted toxin-antitoxin system
MKLLFDHNLSPRLVKLLTDVYPNSNHLYLMGLDQKSDNIIWEIAKKDNYIIVTKDSDFNELLVFKGFPPKIIWIRSGNCSTKRIESLLRNNYDTILSFSEDNNIGILEFMYDKKYEEELTIKRYEILRDYIKHEDSLINNRLTWLLVAQGLIFSAFSSLFKPISDLLKTSTDLHENVDLAIISEIEINSQIAQLKTIQCILSVLGLSISIVSFFTIWAAVLAIRELENSTLEKNIKSSNTLLPDITAGRSSLARRYQLGKIAPFGIPIIIMLGWLYIICDISHFPNYWCCVLLLVGFIFGSTLTIHTIGVYSAKSNIKE